ncbi:MAG: GTPase Era [Kiloniellales bacterium]|nr:GTPase Era [Kiloniellales bacterium]
MTGQDPASPDPVPRCGFAAILGAPNAGKSTLVNALTGAKVSIVTHKVQTTRFRIRGIFIEGASQIVLVDTPGIFQPKRRLERAMVEAAWGGAADADVVLLIFDAGRRDIDPDTRLILDGLKAQGRRAALVLNKIDTVKRERLLALAARFQEEGIFTDTFMIAATTGDGLAELRSFLAGAMPDGPWHYPEDQLTDLPMRLIAAEVTREQLFLRLHQELPYALTVETDAWQDFEDGSVKIEQTVYVQRETHKGICLGKGGRTIRVVREAAQAELQAMLERPVHLFLHVKVRERWVEDPERYRVWGLDYQA